MTDDANHSDRLVAAALRAIERTLADGERRGRDPGEWVATPIAVHLDHARDQAADTQCNEGLSVTLLAIDHAITRLVMARSLLTAADVAALDAAKEG